MIKNLSSSSSILIIITLLCGESHADIVYLKTGIRIEGRIIKETETQLRVRTRGNIEFMIEKSEIESIEKKQTAEDIYFEKANELKEGDAKGHYELGIYCKEKGLVKYAEKEFWESLNLEPDNASAHNQLGIVYLQNREIHGAVLSFQRALTLEPDNEEIERNLSSVLQSYPAEDYLIRESNLADNDAVGHFKLGIFCASRGLNEAAKYEFNKVLNIDGGYKEEIDRQLMVLYQNESEEAYNRAVVLMNRHRYKEASQEFKDVIKRYPDSKIVSLAEAQDNLCETIVKDGEERRKKEAEKKNAEQKNRLYALMRDAQKLEDEIKNLQLSIQDYEEGIKVKEEKVSVTEGAGSVSDSMMRSYKKDLAKSKREGKIKISRVKRQIESKKASLEQTEKKIRGLKGQMGKETIASVEERIQEEGGKEVRITNLVNRYESLSIEGRRKLDEFLNELIREYAAEGK